MAALDAILNDIDTDLENALERLFAFLRIPSISTDPAYAGHCREAAAWLAQDLTALGFETSVEETSLHPVVLAHRPKAGAPQRCCHVATPSAACASTDGVASAAAAVGRARHIPIDNLALARAQVAAAQPHGAGS